MMGHVTDVSERCVQGRCCDRPTARRRTLLQHKQHQLPVTTLWTRPRAALRPAALAAAAVKQLSACIRSV